MKILTIGDLHGSDKWKDIVPELYDKVIFLGDYLDSFTHTDEQIVKNFTEVIAYKYDHFDRVVLMLGNHELSYMWEQFRCTGYRQSLGGTLSYLLWHYYDLFKIAWQRGNYLWTHAGLHQDFYDRKIRRQVLPDDANLAGTLQRLFEEGYVPLFEVGAERGGRTGHVGGPFWIDKRKLQENPLKGYHQIVGHTRINTIEHFQPWPEDEDTTVTFCDCIELGDGKLWEWEG